MRGWPLEGDTILSFYYLSASKIWSGKKSGLWREGPYKKEATVYVNNSLQFI